LRNMRLINRTRLAMLDWSNSPFKSELSSRIYGCGIVNNMSDIKQVSFMEECWMGLQRARCEWIVFKFTVNDNYAVRFGMGAIKGGSGAVATIVENRKDGKYKSILI
jgi:DNA polymerase-3 subunit alpha